MANFIMNNREEEPRGIKSLLGGALKTAPGALDALLGERKQKQQRAEDIATLQGMGYGKVGALHNPELQKLLLANQIKQNENKIDAEAESKSKDVIGKYFGPEAADIYAHLTEGGKTKYAGFLFEDMQRTNNLQQSIENFVNQNPQDVLSENELPKQGPKPVGKTNKELVEAEKNARAESVAFHKESQKYDDEVRASEKTAKSQLEAVKNIRDTIATGKVKPTTASAFFKGLGKWGDKISQAFLTDAEGKLEANIPLLLEGWKDVFGVRLSDADLKILQDKLPSLGKSGEANKSVLDVIEKYAKTPILRAKIGRELKKANGGLRHLSFEDKVEEELEKQLSDDESVVMIAPNGKRKRVPKNQVEAAIASGGKLANE
jgi:hypothetical protein